MTYVITKTESAAAFSVDPAAAAIINAASSTELFRGYDHEFRMTLFIIISSINRSNLALRKICFSKSFIKVLTNAQRSGIISP